MTYPLPPQDGIDNKRVVVGASKTNKGNEITATTVMNAHGDLAQTAISDVDKNTSQYNFIVTKGLRTLTVTDSRVGVVVVEDPTLVLAFNHAVESCMTGRLTEAEGTALQAAKNMIVAAAADKTLADVESQNIIRALHTAAQEGKRGL